VEISKPLTVDKSFRRRKRIYNLNFKKGRSISKKERKKEAPERTQDQKEEY